jgi:predicted enzyme related to lactoylglutathione lyase
MRRVTGIGGVFIKANDPDALRAWYRDHLGVDIQPWGGAVFRRDAQDTHADGVTAWSIFPADSDYFAPSEARFMINYRVEDLGALLDLLRAEGCQVLDQTQQSEFGRFGWAVDPEGNKVELWEPPRSGSPA